MIRLFQKHAQIKQEHFNSLPEKYMLTETRHKARKNKAEICWDKGVADTLLEEESVQISWIYGTRPIGSPCLNAGYHASRPENCVALSWNCWKLLDSFLKSFIERYFSNQHLQKKIFTDICYLKLLVVLQFFCHFILHPFAKQAWSARTQYM